MIKRFTFFQNGGDRSPDDFADHLRTEAQRGAGAPVGVRPVRAAVCLSLPEVLPGAPHDGIVIGWFEDERHLARFDDWSQGAAGRADPVVVADEVVARGAEWLGGRWEAGGTRIKHMALARRADGIGPSEFSERWKARAGQVGAADGRVLVIPEVARGLAYVQNHPRPNVRGEWLYDAVNEVYFDDLESLRRRIEWFAANVGDRPEDDLIGRSWFLAVQEEPVV